MQYATASDIFDEMAALTPSYRGISYARLERGGIQWPCPHSGHPGTAYLHKDNFSHGPGKFNPVVYVPPAELPDAGYPLLLSTGRRYFHYHTGTMTWRTGALEVHYGNEYLEINQVDAAALGITDGDIAQVSSRCGLVKVETRISKVVPQGLVFTSFLFPEVATSTN
ncbi:molybdopterin oxidoreductase family protein [Sporotomaculum syntrophicum]|nr:molybdopterin dinucleotide binding domain-containing protein [Sporotomaculum syntrophicum]